MVIMPAVSMRPLLEKRKIHESPHHSRVSWTKPDMKSSGGVPASNVGDTSLGVGVDIGHEVQLRPPLTR